jgi:hypothetical protein
MDQQKLDEIRARCNARNQYFDPTTVAALLDEIERLREQANRAAPLHLWEDGGI